MYFLRFLWKLTNFGSRFLHNHWTDLSQILNLGTATIKLGPVKFSEQSVHVRTIRAQNVSVPFQYVDLYDS